MSDDLIQAALKECGLDFTDLADDKNMANLNVANNLTNSNQLSSTKIVSESKPLKVLQGNKVICTKSLEPKHATTKLPLIQKNKNPSIIIAESNKSHVIVPQKSSQPDLETKTPTIILQKSQAQPSSQIKNFKNIKIINIQRSNSPVIIKPKIASTDPDKKVVKVIFKATTNQVPSSLSAKVPSSTLQSTPVSHVITFNRNTPKSVPLTNGYLSSSLQTNLLLSKPSPSAIQLTTKSLSPKLKSESVFQKSTVNLSRAPSITLLDSSIPNIPTTCLSPSPSSIIKTSTTPSSNTQNIVFSKTPVVLSSNHINLLSPDVTLIPISTLSSSSSISSSGITITTVHNTTTTLSNTTTCSTNITSTVNNNTSLSNSIKETPLRSTNSPVVKFHIGAFDDDDVDNDATKNNNTDNNKEAQSIKVKEEDEGEGEEGKMRGSGGKDEEACSFFEALQELNEANKKVAETEARLKEEEEEEERTKRIKQLLGQEELSKTPCDTTTPCNDDDSSIEKIVVDDDDDDDSVNYNNISLSNNNTNNLSTESLNKNPIEPTNILEFGRSFNKRYLPQHSSNKYNNILYNNHNSTSNVSSSGGISLLKNAFSFNPNRSYSILRPGDVVSNNFHPLVLNKESLEDELEEEEMGHAETFAAYMPTKLKIGLQHPDAVVESASLSSVEVPDIEYQTSIPSECADQGLLSAVQLETITYACQKHENELPNGDRVGFLIGDGAGVGKGRTIAGIIYENFLRGRRRSLWLSVSSDLKVDAERDLRDIGASSIPVYSLNKFKYTKISSKINGKVKKGVIFSTYSALIGESKANNKYRTRLKQLTHWLGKEFDGLIIFDECHRAKNLFPNGSSKPTKTGRTVVELQRRLPKSRVVYASATGASEPRNMAYMVRLGLWGPGTPFKEFGDFIHAVEKRGVGTMEMVAMEMKQRGTYIARQLSFKGVSFRVEEVAIAQEYADMYNDAVKLWVEARDLFQQATKLLQLDKHHTKVVWSQFWSSHQRFFKYLCISGKVEHCVQLALKAIADGKCVVIGLQSTGESRILDVVEEQGDELTDFVSSAKGVFQKLVETHFPGGNGTSDTTYQAPTPLPPNNKRKISPDSKPAKKRFKKSDSSSDDDSDKSDADNSEGSEDSSGDDDDNDDDDDDADDNSSSESESDTNPFASGSDSDCDVPWIRKKKPKAEKKEKKKKSKKERGKKGDDDEDSDCEYDRDVSRILEALKKKETMEENLKANKTSSSSLKSLTTTSATMGDLNGGDVETVANMKRDLLHKIEELGQILPPNTLDQLIDLFGGPAKVAEMTGRKGRVVCGQDGSIRYERRSVHDVSLEMLNLTEKQRFMDGEKNVAIISEAASSGISLQADRRAINQRRRVHITLELPWSADRAIQQFGRTHRSNQVSAPEYIFLISDLAGEKRFASTVSKRLESLGALTHGDRRAAEARDLSQFNIDNKFGQSALEAVMKSVIGDKPLVTPPVNNTQQFFRDARESLVGVGMVYHNKFSYSLDKESYNISKFLNRILGIEVRTQNHLFNYFSATLKHVMLEAKKNGKWDMGILDLGSLGEKVMKLVSQDFYGSFSGSKTKITLNKVSVERGLSWKDAEKIHNNLDGSDEGFYVSKQTYVKDRKMYILAQATKKHKEIFYKIFRANTGLQTKLWGLNELRLKYRRVTDEAEVRRAWQEQFTLSENQCLHMYQYAKCHNASACEIGRRCRIYHILSGSVLSFWTSVERVLSSFSGQSSKMQVVRARMKDDKRIVGILINSNAISPLIQLLRTGHLEDLPATPPHFQLPQAQQAIRQQKVVSPMYLQQQQQQQKLLQQQKLKQQQQQFQQQQQQNSKPNFVNYSHISSFQKTKVQSQQQLQHQLLQQQQRLQNFHNSYNIPSKPRFANSLSSSSLQQLNNNYNSNTLNNNNNIHKNNHENNINTNNISIKCVDSSSYTIKNNLTILPNSHHYSITNGNQQKITTINNKNNNNDFVVINHLQNNNINNNINKSIVIKTSPVLHNKMPSFTIVPAASLNKPP